MKNNDNTLNFAVVPREFLEKVEADLQELKESIRQKTEEEIRDQWIESIKIPKILGISRKTWQSYRDKRLLPFSQIGSKIYVKRADIESFMSKHYISSRS